MSKCETRPMSKEIRGEKLPYPAKQSDMKRVPQTELQGYKPAGKLEGKKTIITGGDSGIGRAVALAFALEGADVAVFYNVNDGDANETRKLIERRAPARTCLPIKVDVRSRDDCFAAVDRVANELGGLNVLVNNAAYQKSNERFEDVTEEEIRRTFETNIIGYMFMAQAALKHLQPGDAIINTGSIVGLVGLGILIPYTSTKGAIHAFTKSLALNLGERNIRVNAVVPGPVWTPNIPGTMPIEEVENFGHEVALKRPGQPDELGPVYVFLASEDSSFVTGALYEVTGGRLSPS
jgi:NAD(P)-dependent dehydrogenase (short-subunit alcohol dehydrogenase family)